MSEKNISGITKIAVKGFKSIVEEREIDIRPLTILAGANSSGKSSIMQPLLMLKQTLEAPYDPGPLLIDGPNARFTSADQFLSTLADEKREDRFQIRIETCAPDFSHSVATTFRKAEGRIELVEMLVEESVDNNHVSSPERLILYPEMVPEEVKLIIERHLIPKDYDVVKRSRCFLVFGSKDGYTFFTVTPNLESNILNSIHLPGLRGNPERIYKLANTGARYPGTFEHYAASIIHEWQETGDERLKIVVGVLRTLELTGKVSTKRVGDIGIEVQVGRLRHDSTSETDMVSIADVGFGVSQVLPVLVAVIVAEPGQLVYLEQPELHLHPRAQVALARVLVDAAKRGVRVVAETHSSLLLLGIQTLVAEGDIPPELVKFHWFSRNKDGVTEVTSADLDDAGAYGDWPEDFADVSLRAQSGYIKAARSRFIKGT